LIANDKTGLIGSSLIKAGGSFVEGLFNPVTPAQVAALDAQAAQNRAATTLSLTQQANMKAPIPVASRKPVSAAGITGAPASLGLINTPNFVTGTPA
jgi:hypothetical protein